MSDQIARNRFLALFAIYLVSHGGILFIPNAIYWDDWTLYQVANDEILDTMRIAGAIFNLTGHMHVFLLSIGPWFYKTLTFVLMFFSGICLDFILKKHASISQDARFLIVVLFLALPFYLARVALIDMSYTISHFVFFLAWACIEKYRLISLILFFFSFTTNSLLVFFALPFLEFYYRSVEGKVSGKSLIKFSLDKWYMLILPFVFFAIKLTFYAPSGLYSGYNEDYRLVNVFKSPASMVLEWFSVTLPLLPFFFVALLCYLVMRASYSNFNPELSGKKYYWVFFGIAVFVLGAFPYWILGHVPTFSEWTSRHQLLLALGAALTITALISFLTREVKSVFIILILAACLSVNISTYKDFFFDWKKQQALASLIVGEDLIRDADLVLFDDRTLSLNAINRSYRTYEWTGLLASAFEDESRFATNASELENFVAGKMYAGYFSHGAKYRLADFSPNKPLSTVLVTITMDKEKYRSLLNYDPGPIVKIDTRQLEKTVISFD
ncbi:hypothetical protein N9H90_01485 [Pseudomonadales bacterium]|nr:hypothetical protein [Pseudomonadales bacterium]